jgi:hypothetical protein
MFNIEKQAIDPFFLIDPRAVIDRKSGIKVFQYALIALAIFCPLNSFAADLVVGTISCKEWVEDRSNGSNSFNKPVDESWVMGFLGAYAKATRTNFLVNVKTETIYIWMDKYCASHQSNKIGDGVLILAHELIQKMKK